MNNLTNSYYQEGFQSYRKNKGNYSNPYAIGTNEHNNFERGWSQALKRYPELYARAERYTTFADCSATIRREEEIQKSKKQYLKSKGE